MENEINLPIHGVSEELTIQLKQIIRDNTLDIAGMERKARSFLNDFQWPEFDDWFDRFKQMDYWPYMWGSIGSYVQIQNASLPDLLKELTKDQLQNLAGEDSVPIKKSHSKKQILDSFEKATTKPDRTKVLEIVNQNGVPAICVIKERY